MVYSTEKTIERLNKEFSLDNKKIDEKESLFFELGQGGVAQTIIHNSQASARISLQGAHLLSWNPKADDDVIWVSENAQYAVGKSVRGGIPVCWPWFGPHASNNQYPAHGFARTSMWQVTATESLSPGVTQICLELDTTNLNEDIQNMWPWPTTLHYRITVSDTLALELCTRNQSHESIVISQALHTYFRVADITQTRIYGLENTAYLDKTENFQSKTQAGPISITSETDRVYLHTQNDVTIDTPERQILVEKQASNTTVVWNPWKTVAKNMADMNNDGYLKMLCVESANTADDTVTIAAGESHCLRAKYSIKQNSGQF